MLHFARLRSKNLEEAQHLAAEEEAKRLAAEEAQRKAAEEEARLRAEADQAASQVASLDPEDQASPTQSIAAQSATYDGDWILEIFIQNDRSNGEIVETKIAGGKFSVRYAFSRKTLGRGFLVGEIDLSGRLSAIGTGSGYKTYFSASYQNGSFQTVANRITGKWNIEQLVGSRKLEFILTRATP